MHGFATISEGCLASQNPWWKGHGRGGDEWRKGKQWDAVQVQEIDGEDRKSVV